MLLSIVLKSALVVGIIFYSVSGYWANLIMSGPILAGVHF
jgi:hypothetical protein